MDLKMNLKYFQIQKWILQSGRAEKKMAKMWSFM